MYTETVRTRHFVARTEFATNTISLDIFEGLGPREGRDRVRIAQPVTFTTLDVGDRSYVGPAFEITRDQAQELFDSLSRCGLRPSVPDVNDLTLKMTQAHIADLRAMINRMLEIRNHQPAAHDFLFDANEKSLDPTELPPQGTATSRPFTEGGPV